MSKLGIARATRIVELCTDLSLAAEHERLTAELSEEKWNSVVDDREVSAKSGLVREIRDLEAKMNEHTVVFTLGALPRKQWVEFEAAHPPREGDEVDEQYRVNLSTFVDAVMPKSILSVKHKVSGEPVEFTGSDWLAEADEMSNGQWESFALALLAVNRGVTAAPFSRAASVATRRSGQN